jgi:hypothetical protein
MPKLITLLFLFVFTISCNKTDGTEIPTDTTDGVVTSPATGTGDESGTDTGADTGGDTTPTPPATEPTPPPADNSSSVPTAALTFGANVYFVNFTAAQEDKYNKAIEIVKKVVASEEFRSKVLNHTYNGSKTYVDNNGKTNAQIYQMILDGAEKLQPSKNNAMDVEVELYYAATTTVGYTYANSKRIWVNTKYFNTYTPASVAGNLFHEWLHKVGFGHASTYSVSRDYSVPYAIGRMISSMGNQYL